MKCLIVEDDPFLNFVLAENFTQLNHPFCLARSVAEATDMLRKAKFDLIVLDHYLPDGMSGDVSFLAASTQPNCRIILLTGAYSFPRGEHTLMSPGVDWVLRKPLKLDELNALLDYADHDRVWHPTAAAAVL